MTLFWVGVAALLLVGLLLGYYILAGLLLAVWGAAYLICRAVGSERAAVVGSVLTLWVFSGALVWALTRDGQGAALCMGIVGVGIWMCTPWIYASD